MNFYDFHIGDYASRTAHLEPMEDLAYRRMLDLYYVREGPLPFETADIARLIRMRGQEEAIEAVLHEFFDNMEAGWIHQRCQEVIAAAQDKRTKAKASADKRWGNDGNADGMRTHSGGKAKAKRSDSEGNAPSPSPSPINTPQPPKGEPQGFAEFYEAYPRKVARPKAMKAFAKVKVPLATLLAAVERQKRSELWTKEGGSFIPYPATWLNDERWNDQAATATPTHPASAVFVPPKPLTALELAANKARADQVAASLGIPNMKVKH